VPLNRDFIGRSYPPGASFVIGREHIHAFAKAIGDPNPLYHDPEAARAAGYADVVAPPTFLTTLSFRYRTYMEDAELGLDFSRVVHGEQHFVLHRPIVAGLELSSRTTVTAIADAGRNEKLTAETEVRDSAGELIAVATNTIISRGTAAPKEA
jgi:acyl dehydratase